MKVLIFVNSNTTKDSASNVDVSQIAFQLGMKANTSGFIPIGMETSNNRLSYNDIIKYIYSKNNNDFEAIYFADKSNIADNNDDVLRLVTLAEEKYNLQIITDKEGNLTKAFKDSEKVILEKQKRKKSSQAFNSRIKSNEQAFFSGGRIPFGYTVSHDNSYEINEDEANIIKEIFTMYKDGVRAINISRVIGDKYNMKFASGGYWKADRIFGYLSNPMYNGRPTINRTTKNEKGNTIQLPKCDWKISFNQHEELMIIDDDTFNKVQERLWKLDNDRPVDYKLTWEENKNVV